MVGDDGPAVTPVSRSGTPSPVAQAADEYKSLELPQQAPLASGTFAWVLDRNLLAPRSYLERPSEGLRPARLQWRDVGHAPQVLPSLDDALRNDDGRMNGYRP